jgi:hypothetical protein
MRSSVSDYGFRCATSRPGAIICPQRGRGLIFRRRTSEAEAAEAATLRALLRQKADDCFKAGQFLAPKSRVLEEMAEKETDLKSAERLYGNAFEAETEARAAFAVWCVWRHVRHKRHIVAFVQMWRMWRDAHH